MIAFLACGSGMEIPIGRQGKVKLSAGRLGRVCVHRFLLGLLNWRTWVGGRQSSVHSALTAACG